MQCGTPIKPLQKSRRIAVRWGRFAQLLININMSDGNSNFLDGNSDCKFSLHDLLLIVIQILYIYIVYRLCAYCA